MQCSEEFGGWTQYIDDYDDYDDGGENESELIHLLLLNQNFFSLRRLFF